MEPRAMHGVLFVCGGGKCSKRTVSSEFHAGRLLPSAKPTARPGWRVSATEWPGLERLRETTVSLKPRLPPAPSDHSTEASRWCRPGQPICADSEFRKP